MVYFYLRMSGLSCKHTIQLLGTCAFIHTYIDHRVRFLRHGIWYRRYYYYNYPSLVSIDCVFSATRRRRTVRRCNAARSWFCMFYTRLYTDKTPEVWQSKNLCYRIATEIFIVRTYLKIVYCCNVC